MSYLLPAGTAPRTKTKWGLGYARGLGRWKLYQNSAQLGQDTPCDQPDPNDPSITVCGQPIPSTAPLPDLVPPRPAFLPSVQQPGVNPSVQAAYANLLTQQQNSRNPLDYVSPQAAIAAGLPAQQVYNAWSTALARFPSQQAALNAGIPAGVVTELWAQSRAAAPASTSNTFLGVPVTYLFGGGLAILALAGLRGRR